LADFPRFDEQLESLVPIRELTTEMPGCIHRFYDSSPISPSGRYVALTRIQDETRGPVPGEAADVVLVDLETGTLRMVAQTACWDTQLGAQVQWGAGDHELLFNTLDDAVWEARAVVLDPQSGSQRRLDGAVYHASPDGSRIASPALHRIGFTQLGYGLSLPQQVLQPNIGAPEDDGVFVTSVETGQTSLVLSLAEIYERLRADLQIQDLGPASAPKGALYGFHVKWSPSGDRLMFVVRYRGLRDGPGWTGALVTCRPDGSDPRVAVPASVWSQGGHHPHWCPDGEHIIMNLSERAIALARGEDLDGTSRELRFARISTDGTVEPFHPSTVGSGHPTLHPDGRHILTDAYPHEAISRPGSLCPLRWVDTRGGGERPLLWMPLSPAAEGPFRSLRVDMHPAWDREHRRVVVNGTRDGHRYVYLVDMRGVV
jgi:hypothetical protein